MAKLSILAEVLGVEQVNSKLASIGNAAANVGGNGLQVTREDTFSSAEIDPLKWKLYLTARY